MAWTDQIDVADEHFHRSSDDPYWSENTPARVHRPGAEPVRLHLLLLPPEHEPGRGRSGDLGPHRRGRLQLPLLRLGPAPRDPRRRARCTTSSCRTR